MDTRVVLSPPADAGPSHHGGFWRAPKGSRRLRAQEASSPEQGAGQGAQVVLHVPLGLAHHRGAELTQPESVSQAQPALQLLLG